MWPTLTQGWTCYPEEALIKFFFKNKIKIIIIYIFQFCDVATIGNQSIRRISQIWSLVKGKVENDLVELIV
jgi:hypothetical protein